MTDTPTVTVTPEVFAALVDAFVRESHFAYKCGGVGNPTLASEHDIAFSLRRVLAKGGDAKGAAELWATWMTRDSTTKDC
jgi:hypothetical protein